MPADKKIAVVCFQLGGPDRQGAVEPFLYNLFCDPDIINFPGSFLARKPLAKLISTTRSKTVRQHYAEIGGGSPIRRLTEQQARALEVALRPHISARTFVAMRYWHPNTEEAIAGFAARRFRRTRSAAALSALFLCHHRQQPEGMEPRCTSRRFPCTSSITFSIIRITSRESSSASTGCSSSCPIPRKCTLVFSAHGLPMALVEKGDPYPQQIEATVRLVRELGAWENPHVLCFQSKVGPQKWLQPSLTATIEKMAREGIRRMLVIPISFLTEHIETLYEINIEAREQAESLGVTDFHMMPALNDSPLLIRALADLVLRAVGAGAGVASFALYLRLAVP